MPYCSLLYVRKHFSSRGSVISLGSLCFPLKARVESRDVFVGASVFAWVFPHARDLKARVKSRDVFVGASVFAWVFPHARDLLTRFLVKKCRKFHSFHSKSRMLWILWNAVHLIHKWVYGGFSSMLVKGCYEICYDCQSSAISSQRICKYFGSGSYRCSLRRCSLRHSAPATYSYRNTYMTIDRSRLCREKSVICQQISLLQRSNIASQWE